MRQVVAAAPSQQAVGWPSEFKRELWKPADCVAIRGPTALHCTVSSFFSHCLLSFLFGCIRCVEFEKDDIPVLHDVVPALLPVFPSSLRKREWNPIRHIEIASRDNFSGFLCSHSIWSIESTNLDCIFTSLLFEVGILHHLSHDEAFFKVGVDLSCSLRSLSAFLLEREKREKTLLRIKGKWCYHIQDTVHQHAMLHFTQPHVAVNRSLYTNY